MNKIRSKWYVHTMLRSTGAYSLEGIFDTKDEAQSFVDANKHRYQTYTRPKYHPTVTEAISDAEKEFIELRIEQNIDSVWGWLNGGNSSEFIASVKSECAERRQHLQALFENDDQLDVYDALDMMKRIAWEKRNA